jgi:hypothetical protein
VVPPDATSLLTLLGRRGPRQASSLPSEMHGWSMLGARNLNDKVGEIKACYSLFYIIYIYSLRLDIFLTSSHYRSFDHQKPSTHVCIRLTIPVKTKYVNTRAETIKPHHNKLCQPVFGRICFFLFHFAFLPDFFSLLTF